MNKPCWGCWIDGEDKQLGMLHWFWFEDLGPDYPPEEHPLCGTRPQQTDAVQVETDARKFVIRTVCKRCVGALAKDPTRYGLPVPDSATRAKLCVFCYGAP